MPKTDAAHRIVHSNRSASYLKRLSLSEDSEAPSASLLKILSRVPPLAPAYLSRTRTMIEDLFDTFFEAPQQLSTE